MNNRGDVSWLEDDSSDEDFPLATYLQNDGVVDSNSHLITLLVNDTECDEDNVSEDDVCSSESDYIPSEDATESDNDEVVIRTKNTKSLRQLSRQPPNKRRKTTVQSRSVTPASAPASTDVFSVSNEPSAPLSSSSASQYTRDDPSTQRRDSPPILSFSQKRLRGRNGHWLFTEPRSSIVGRRPAHKILTSYTPGPIFPSSFSGDTQVDYLKLLLAHSITKEIVEKTNACMRILRDRAKHHAKATFKDTCEEEILALIGVLLLSGVNEDNHVATEEMFKPTTGIPAYRTGFSEGRFCFLLRYIRCDDSETSDQRKKEKDPFAAVRKIWEVFINNCKQRYCPGENITIDEQLLAFRGRCVFRMYIRNKPAKYGLKIMMVCDSKSSYMLNAMPYLGKKTKPPNAVALGHCDYGVVQALFR